MATSLTQIIVFRVFQGLAGGGLQPSSQGVLLDAFPPEKQGTAQTLFGVAALFGPIVGPTLGGWLVVNYDWRWIFYVNVPVGLLALAVNWFLVRDPEYLKKERAELRKQPLNFDVIGLGLWRWSWPRGKLCSARGRSGTGWATRSAHPNAADDRRRRLRAAVVPRDADQEPDHQFPRASRPKPGGVLRIIFCVYAILYAASFSLPNLLQELFGYDALASGLVLSPSGFSTIAGMIVVGILLGKGVDARWLIPIGLVIAAIGNYWMSLMNLDISPWQAAAAGGAVRRVGIYLCAAERGRFQIRFPAASRRGGGHVGLAPQRRRQRRHFDRADDNGASRAVPHLAAERTSRSAPSRARCRQQQGQQFFLQHTGDPAASQHMTLQVVANLRDQQALSLAYFDVFWFCAVVPLALIALVFIMRPSVAEKGAHGGGVGRVAGLACLVFNFSVVEPNVTFVLHIVLSGDDGIVSPKIEIVAVDLHARVPH